ncbi:MAG TPA: hypothetical protein VK043_06465 [Burkholderiales bacterium]|nr:hypothetical protein [Burkholderiales bacterium]
MPPVVPLVPPLPTVPLELPPTPVLAPELPPVEPAPLELPGVLLVPEDVPLPEPVAPAFCCSHASFAAPVSPVQSVVAPLLEEPLPMVLPLPDEPESLPEAPAPVLEPLPALPEPLRALLEPLVEGVVDDGLELLPVVAEGLLLPVVPLAPVLPLLEDCAREAPATARKAEATAAVRILICIVSLLTVGGKEGLRPDESNRYAAPAAPFTRRCGRRERPRRRAFPPRP